MSVGALPGESRKLISQVYNNLSRAELFSDASDSRVNASTMSGGSLQSGQTSALDEDEQLYRLGVKRELRREFKNFSAISFAVGILGCVFDHKVLVTLLN